MDGTEMSAFSYAAQPLKQVEDIDSGEDDTDDEEDEVHVDDDVDWQEELCTIRLLRVLPLDDDAPDDLVCELTVADTSEEYLALSYVWGPAEPSQNLQLKADTSSGTLNIRQNLYEFLLQARQRSDENWFWVDAICIDQDSVSERNEQVQHISLIYKSAAKVVVWLNDKYVSRMFRAIEDHHDEFMNSNYDERNADGTVAEYVDDLPWLLMDQQWGIRHFYSHQYWSRVWIRQEFTLANDIVLWSGDYSLDLEAVPLLTRHFYLRIGMKDEKLFRRIYGHVDDIYSHRDWQHSKEPRDREMRKLTYYLQREGRRSDIRDRIYATLSLVEDGDWFEVDYDQTAYQLFCRVCDHFDGEDASGGRLSDYLRALQIESTQIFEEVKHHGLSEHMNLKIHSASGSLVFAGSDSLGLQESLCSWVADKPKVHAATMNMSNVESEIVLLDNLLGNVLVFQICKLTP